MISGSGSDAESLSAAEMDVIVYSDSSSRLDVISAVCASSEGDTTLSMDTPTVTASDPSHGPSVASIIVGPFRLRAKDLSGLRYPSRSQGSRQRSFHEK